MGAPFTLGLIWVRVNGASILPKWNGGPIRTREKGLMCNARSWCWTREGSTCVGLVGEAGVQPQRLRSQVLHVTSMYKILY
jgi:hypothetical protein